MRALIFGLTLLCLILFSCNKRQDIANYNIATKKDFALFLATRPINKIDSSSYNFGKDDIFFNLFEETDGYTWFGQEWHQNNVFPLWLMYKKEHNLLSENEYIKVHFKNFLATRPFPGIDEFSYEKGENAYFLNLFEETGQYSWKGQEWHRKNVLPLWKKYKQDNNLKIRRFATLEDFSLFLNTKPIKEIDSSSYNNGQDLVWFTLFQEKDLSKWIGKEWHRDYVLPKWAQYKVQNNLR